ncbi:hypothetical protein FRC07_009963, partial [Ceratobasidium sp. 392]
MFIPQKNALGVKSHSQDAAPEPRRSVRGRRPSLHKLESGALNNVYVTRNCGLRALDEYEASSRASSRPPSPAGPKSKPQSKKSKSDKPGSRPGRIVQPAPSTRPTRDSSSPEPFTAPRPPPRNSLLAHPASASKTSKVANKAECVERASGLLGYNASRLSQGTIEKVLNAGIPPKSQAAQADPMGLKGGSAPSVSQSARGVLVLQAFGTSTPVATHTVHFQQGVVLGSQHQPPTAAATDNTDASQGPDQPHALSRDQRARDPSPLNVPPVNDNTATEPESEPEDIKLKPGDSVSQRLPNIAYSSLPPLDYPSTPSAPAAGDPDLVNATAPLDGVPMDLDTGTVNQRDTSGSDADADSETELSEAVRALEQQRLAQPHQQSAASHRPNLPCSHSRSSAARHPPPHSVAEAQPSAHVPRPASVPRAAPNRSNATSTIPIFSVSLSMPPPVSDVDGELRRSHLVPSAPEPQAGTVQPRKHGRHHFVEDNSAELEAEAALKLGLHV